MMMQLIEPQQQAYSPYRPETMDDGRQTTYYGLSSVVHSPFKWFAVGNFQLVLLFIVGIGIFILQSTLLSWLGYDFVLPFIVFIAVYYPGRLAFPVCLFMGFIIDVFSGGILGLFTSIYFWLCCAIKAILQILNLQNTLISFALVAGSCLIENATVIFFISVLSNYQLDRSEIFHGLVVQPLVVGAFAPLLFFGFSMLVRIRTLWLR
ncbi:MAG: hypothetical protein V1753_01220 [Pseudomonadota bacterium]